MLKKYLVPLVTVFTISFSLAVAQAPNSLPQAQTVPVVTRNDIQLTVSRYAFVYGVDEALLHKVIHCESTHNPNAIGDEGFSRGLVQIHAKYHPNITDEQAFDVDFAVKFLAKSISEGKGNWWTCFRKIKSV